MPAAKHNVAPTLIDYIAPTILTTLGRRWFIAAVLRGNGLLEANRIADVDSSLQSLRNEVMAAVDIAYSAQMSYSADHPLTGMMVRKSTDWGLNKSKSAEFSTTATVAVSDGKIWN